MVYISLALFLANVQSYKKIYKNAGILKISTHCVLYYFFVKWCLTQCFLKYKRNMGRRKPRLCLWNHGGLSNGVGAKWWLERAVAAVPKCTWSQADIPYLTLFNLYKNLIDVGITDLVLQMKRLRLRKVKWLAKVMSQTHGYGFNPRFILLYVSWCFSMSA